jgi:ferrous iron transport protein A
LGYLIAMHKDKMVMDAPPNRKACCWRERLKRCFDSHHGDDCVGPLSQRGRCGRVKICKVVGDRALCGRIAAMGVYPGAEADVISSAVGLRHIIKVNGGTVSLNTDLSENIIVTSL